VDVADALAYLDRHVNLEARAGRIDGLSLDNMRRLMEVLGDPHRAYPVIHLTGTNGKGSVARLITALLVESGLTVGGFTSPHLERLNERIARNGEAISDDELAEAIGEVAALEALADVVPSYFEIMTAAALAWFARVAVDVAVVEVGLLGRYDATNVVDADVAVVTNIGFDHTDGVGDWRQAIASEKAGIVKPDSFLVLGETAPELAAIFRAEGPREVWERDLDFAIDSNLAAVGGRVLDLHTPYGALEQIYLPWHGGHQGDNAAVAIAAVEAFFGRGLADDVVNAAFAELTNPGRLEVAGRSPLIVIDGAHNPDGAEVARATIDEDFAVAGRYILVVGLLAGRDIEVMLEALGASQADLVIGCTPDSPRAIPADDIARVASALGVEADAIPDVGDALDAALASACPDDAILVAGSLYVAGAARRHLLH
jgi:dihydrofolate synthase / folylpolyglutamate synthase